MDALLNVLDHIGQGASVLFAATGVADELYNTMQVKGKDAMDVGERIIATELLHLDTNMFGTTRAWFSSDGLVRMARAGKFYDVSRVLDAMDNLDIGAYVCYDEVVCCDSAEQDSDWADFKAWRERIMLLPVNILRLRMIISVKLYCIRLRRRCAALGGPGASRAAKRFKTAAGAAQA